MSTEADDHDTSNPLGRTARERLPITPDAAFRLFTDGFFTWWPRHHHLSDAPSQAVWIEPRPDGRMVELDVEGHSWLWGHVEVWSPGQELVLSLGVNADYDYVPPPGPATRIAVTFEEIEGGTDVTLVHDRFEALGADHARRLLADIDETDYWTHNLAAYAAAAS